MEELKEVLLSIPEEVANLQLPDPGLRDHYLDEQNRVYWLDTQIDDTTLELVKYIFRCNKEDMGKSVEERKRILVMIDSPGGSVEVLGALIGATKNSKTPVWTCCYCTAYSAAADYLSCGHRRFALEESAYSAGYSQPEAQQRTPCRCAAVRNVAEQS
jgi:hypothetical protein